MPFPLAYYLFPVTPILALDQLKIVSSAELPISSSEISISLSDDNILVNGVAVSNDSSNAVYTSHDIIYYEDKDSYESGNPYGEDTISERHSAEEAAKHTVVNITQPGTYRISGELSYGQIFVNVGKEEKDKVTLILDNVNINCTVAPAIFFYKVYECNTDATTETATNQVDTSQAGARVILADNSVNAIKGSHVARIYKDNAEQKKLHKYDGAFYSRMSMEIDGESKGNGILNITADNEGLDTEMHLTLNGGVIHIQSADDGINVNEDGISVLTINGGYLSIFAGNGKEGDGIDSNGWIVINDGTVISLANPNSMDGGIDSDMGTSLNGGKGDRLDMNDHSERPAFPNNSEMPHLPEKGELPTIPEDMKFPMMPENSERPAPPEGMENSGRPNSFGGNMQSSSDTESYDFVLTSSSRGFTDVASNSWYTEAIKFSDADPTAYYYDAVLWASQEDIIKGIDTNTFGVGQSITLKDAITMFNRYEQNTNFTSLIENATSSEPATRAQIAFLLMHYYNR